MALTITLNVDVNTVLDNGKADIINCTGVIAGSATTPPAKNNVGVLIGDPAFRGLVKGGKKFTVTLTEVD